MYIQAIEAKKVNSISTARAYCSFVSEGYITCVRLFYKSYGVFIMTLLNGNLLHHRYADIIVHRLLAVSIGADVTYPELLDKRKSQALSHNLNYRNRMAQYAGRASVALHTHVSPVPRECSEI
jgi:hypothetical protein